MRLSAEIKWVGSSSITSMRNHLGDFVCSNQSIMSRVFKGSTPPYPEQVEASVKCGKVAKRSFFVFLRSKRNRSRIIGTCSTNHVSDLIEDFDFLKEQMTRSNLTFAISHPKISLYDNKLFEKVNSGFFHMKSILADLFGVLGLISSASAYLLFDQLKGFTFILFVLGFVFWFGSIAIGCLNRPQYVLIEQK